MAIVISGTTNDILVNGVSVATDAEVSSAVASGVAPKVDLANFIGTNQVLSGSGYQKLPGGLIIQWGNVINTGLRQVGITFPIAFPNAILNGSITTNNGTVTTVNGGSVYSLGNGGMAAALNTTYSFYWFAIGY